MFIIKLVININYRASITEGPLILRKMPVPGGVYQQQGPSCFDRMKMGFFLGFCVGMASGALFGGFSALRF